MSSSTDLHARPAGRGVRRTQLERRTGAERALLDAAVELIAAQGVDQTSLAQIGERAGFSRGMVNHHFGSRAALVERLAARTQAAFVDSLDSDQPEDEREALTQIARKYLDAVRDSGDVVRAFFVMWGAANAAGSPLRPVFVTDDDRFRSAIEALVERGRARGTIRGDVDPVGFAVSYVALLRGVAAQYLIDERVDLIAAGATCERFVELMVAPEGAGRR